MRNIRCIRLQAVTLLPLLLVDSAGRVPIVVAVMFVSSGLDQFFLPARTRCYPASSRPST